MLVAFSSVKPKRSLNVSVQIKLKPDINIEISKNLVVNPKEEEFSVIFKCNS